jgi:hypothetical protein
MFACWHWHGIMMRWSTFHLPVSSLQLYLWLGVDSLQLRLVMDGCWVANAKEVWATRVLCCSSEVYVYQIEWMHKCDTFGCQLWCSRVRCTRTRWSSASPVVSLTWTVHVLFGDEDIPPIQVGVFAYESVYSLTSQYCRVWSIVYQSRFIGWNLSVK